jgi:hypothetical protein
VSQCVTTYNHKDPTKQADVRTVHSVLDRHGIAARFLRLAHRINMEQLKLAEAEQPPPVRPLTEEELDEEERQAAADAAELAARRSRRPGGTLSDEPNLVRGNEPPRGSTLADSPTEPESGDANASAAQPCCTSHNTATPATPPPGPAEPAERAASVHNLHNLHNENPPEIGATANPPCTCGHGRARDEISQDTCIIDCDRPPWPEARARTLARWSQPLRHPPKRRNRYQRSTPSWAEPNDDARRVARIVGAISCTIGAGS